jgi:hypothetical protein
VPPLSLVCPSLAQALKLAPLLLGCTPQTQNSSSTKVSPENLGSSSKSLAHTSNKCALPPRMHPCSCNYVIPPRMGPFSCKCAQLHGSTLHTSLFPPSSRSQDQTLVRPPLVNNAPKCSPNPHSLFLFASLLLTQSLK